MKLQCLRWVLKAKPNDIEVSDNIQNRRKTTKRKCYMNIELEVWCKGKENLSDIRKRKQDSFL